MINVSEILQVLIVEDDKDTCRLLGMYLAKLGHVVTTAKTMAEGLAALYTSKFDVLISDIGLPDGSGWELVDRAEESCPRFAIAMSGFGLSTDKEKSAAAGFRYHLVKPFAPPQLKTMLDEAVMEKSAAA